MTDFSNFIFILLFLLSIFLYTVLNIYILSFLFVLGIVLFVTYRGYIRKIIAETVKRDRRNGMIKRKIEKMSGRRKTTGGHPLSPKPHKIHNTYQVSPNISSRTPLTPLHKSPWSSSSVLNDHLNDTSMIKKRSTWTSGKTTPSFLHNESNVSPWSNSINQSHMINDKSDVASATLPAFLPMIKRALGLERLPEPNYSSLSRQAIVPIPNTGLSPGVYPNFRTRKQERLSLSERNTSMYRKTNTVKIAPPDPSRTLSPYLSRLKADSSMTEKSTPDTRAVVTALKERRKRSMNVQEETTPDVPIHHAKRRRQESQHSNASTSSLSSLHEALPDLSQHDYNIPRLETSALKRPSRPSQDQNDDYESELSVKRPRQQTRNNAVWSSLSSSRKMVQRREISSKDFAKRKLDLTDTTDKENTETLSKFQRMDTVKLTPEISFTKEQRKKPDRDSPKSPESSLNGSRVLKGIESEPSRPSMLTNLSSKKSSLSIYSEMNTRPKKVPYANVRATLEDYDKDKEAEHKRVQQMLQDVDEDYNEKSAADKAKSIIVTTVTSSFTTAPVSTTTAFIPTSLNSGLGLKSTSQISTTCSEPITSGTVAPVPSVSLALPNGEIPKTPPKEVIPQQESGEGNKSFSGFLLSNQTSQNRSETQSPVYSNSIQFNLKAPDSQQSSVTASTPGFNFAAGTTGVTSLSQPQFSFKPVFPLSSTTTTASSGIAEGFNFKFSGGSGASATNSSGFSLPAGTTATNSSGFSLPAGTTASNTSGFSLPAGTTAINNSGFSFAAGTTIAAPSLKFSTINTSSNQAPILSTTESFPLLHKSSSAPSSGTVFNFAANSSAPSSMTGSLNFTQPTSSAPASVGFNLNVNKTTASTVGGFTFGTNTTTSSAALGSFSFATNKTTSSANSGFDFSTNTTASNATGGFNFTPNSMASNTGNSFKSPANTSVPSAASGFQSGNSLNLGQTNANLNFPSSMTSSVSAPVFNTGTFSFSSNAQSNTAASATGDASNMSKFGAVSGTTDSKPGVGFNFSADPGKISFKTGLIGGGTNPFGQSGTVTQQATNAFGKNVTVNQQTSNIFGQNIPTSQQTSNIFGQNTPTSQQTSNIFGQNTTTSQQTSNIFGQNTTTSQQTSNIFGQNTTTSQQTSNIFGQNTTTSQQTSNIFGQNTPTSQQTSTLFGQNTTANQNVTSPFGQSGKTNQPMVNLFGQSTPANQQKPNLFGQTGPTNQQTSNMFGQSGIVNQQTPNVFGQSGTANQQNPNMFGQIGTASQQTPNMFGQSASSNQQTSNPFVQSGSTFGTSLSSSAPFVFGQGGSTQTDSQATKGFNFSASSVATPQFNFNANSSFGTPGFGSPPSNPFTAGPNVFSVGSSSSTAPRPRSMAKGKRRTGKK